MSKKNKVHSGILFDVYQREQEQFDGSYKTFEKVDRINTAFVIATQGEKIYITYQTQPGKEYRYHSFLGGMVPRDVSELTQAQDELLEESGMTSSDWELWKIYTSGTSAIDRETHLFIARDCQIVADQSLDPGGEKIEVLELTFDQCIDMISDGRLGRWELRADILQMRLDNTLDNFRSLIY